jgi:hypothetical protein
VRQDALDVIDVQRSLGRFGSLGRELGSIGHSFSR